ncbi:GNAT family N-acetyltransferase [Chloroflexota bacterium]
MPYIIRDYRPGDFDGYVQLHVDAERLEPSGRCTSPQALAGSLARPNYSPKHDLFIAETGGKVVGGLNITPELGIGRVVLDCLIHPEHRRKGLATRLFHSAMRRASNLGASLAHVSIPQDNIAASSLLSGLGFGFVRRSLELTLGLAEVRLPDGEHIALSCRHLQRGEEDRLTEIQNRSFAGAWGYNPNTTEETIYRVNLSNCSHEHIVLVCEGHRPIGYCWTTISLEQNEAAGTSKGRIYMIGVGPAYQGRGAGKQALLAGLSQLKSRGIAVAELTVDSENKVARALYESVGFKIQSISAWYEKALAYPET